MCLDCHRSKCEIYIMSLFIYFQIGIRSCFITSTLSHLRLSSLSVTSPSIAAPKVNFRSSCLIVYMNSNIIYRLFHFEYFYICSKGSSLLWFNSYNHMIKFLNSDFGNYWGDLSVMIKPKTDILLKCYKIIYESMIRKLVFEYKWTQR